MTKNNPMKSKSTVFVGNIDFNVTEEEIIAGLSTVGKVISFKLMTDKATNKSKGFGFCEYESPLIAEKAIKHLNISFNNRQVVVNYAEKDAPQSVKEEVSLDINNIISVLENMDRDNLKEVIIYMKNLAIAQPTYFKELMSKNTNLIYALLYALKLLKLVDDSTINGFVKKSFNIDDNKMQIIERIKNITDEEIQGFSQDVRDKINVIRESILKEKEG